MRAGADKQKPSGRYITMEVALAATATLRSAAYMTKTAIRDTVAVVEQK